MTNIGFVTDSSQISAGFYLQGLRWAAAARASACQMYPDVYEETYRLKVYLVGGFSPPLCKMMEFLNGKDYIFHIWPMENKSHV
jgi:hypothetical protein